MNDNGEVVGSTTIAGDQWHHPFLWDGTQLIDLGTFGGPNGEADWVNNTGDVVGIAQSTTFCSTGPGGGHAFLWHQGILKDLGTTAGLDNSEAVAINSTGQVVGYSFNCDLTASDAFLWENGGPIVDLDRLIVRPSTSTVVSAVFINDQGEIGCQAQHPDTTVNACVLIPCDENHPVVEGCDYTLVDASAASNTGVSDSPHVIPNTSNTSIIEPLKKGGGSGSTGGSGGPSATLSPTSLRFLCRNVINTGCECLTERTTTLSNAGSANLSINGISTTGAFTQTNNCGTSLGPGESCTISVY